MVRGESGPLSHSSLKRESLGQMGTRPLRSNSTFNFIRRRHEGGLRLLVEHRYLMEGRWEGHFVGSHCLRRVWGGAEGGEAG